MSKRSLFLQPGLHSVVSRRSERSSLFDDHVDEIALLDVETFHLVVVHKPVPVVRQIDLLVLAKLVACLVSICDLRELRMLQASQQNYRATVTQPGLYIPS